MTDYLTLAEVLAIHLDQIERYGGTHGVRDPGLLESALFGPQTGILTAHDRALSKQKITQQSSL